MKNGTVQGAKNLKWDSSKCKCGVCLQVYSILTADDYSDLSVLLLHLKRFHYTRYFRDKMCDLVHFPLRNLNLGPYVLGPGSGSAKYDLLSVSNHMGRLGGGHYTASVYHTQENR